MILFRADCWTYDFLSTSRISCLALQTKGIYLFFHKDQKFDQSKTNETAEKILSRNVGSFSAIFKLLCQQIDVEDFKKKVDVISRKLRLEIDLSDFTSEDIHGRIISSYAQIIVGGNIILDKLPVTKMVSFKNCACTNIFCQFLIRYLFELLELLFYLIGFYMQG